ncbi:MULTISPECIES: ATP-dependent helicase HrpB [unclassified Paenibacillus]|uniref:ATP-dependent helicase HrpB n=1 Tax=unclassified Paenibacillus TaxID=185978 RepID=UPI002F416BCC
MKQLPIDAILPELLQKLEQENNIVLTAEPGAGKTTRVPLALLNQSWAAGKKIIMLEPRRLAAKSAAQYMAASLQQKAGGTVGYRVKLDTCISESTRIEVVTEGILTRMLQHDPSLSDVAAIIFDEFHERHIHGDLGLALCLQAQELFRDDLRIIVMSATLDTNELAQLLGNAPIIASQGRSYPVSIQYLDKPSSEALDQCMCRLIVGALQQCGGDVLAFLPGIGEIRKTARLLEQQLKDSKVCIHMLHGSMPLEAQSAAIAAAPPGFRKIVLATSIAETSITVEGITAVVDSGKTRIQRFSYRTGMSRLETVPISAAAAQQRSGRAGRLAPGRCYRAWTEQEHRLLSEHHVPEILLGDLSQLALELRIWGIKGCNELNWVTVPAEAAFNQAIELLQLLGAIDEAGHPTKQGIATAQLGVHPRLGAIILKALSYGQQHQACMLASMLSERTLAVSAANQDVDTQLQNLLAYSSQPAAQKIIAQAKQWEMSLARIMAASGSNAEEKLSTGVLLSYGYPDRIARQREDKRYLLANGRGAGAIDDALLQTPFIVACEIEDVGKDSYIRSAAAISLPELRQYCSSLIIIDELIQWEEAGQSVKTHKQERIGAIILKEQIIPNHNWEMVTEQLIAQLRKRGLTMLHMTKQARQLQQRMQLMYRYSPGSWPNVSDEGLLQNAEQGLKPYIYGKSSAQELGKVSVAQLLAGMLSWEQQKELDEQLPTHITVPSGSKLPIDYSDPDRPILSARLQELFGMKQTPMLADGNLPVTIQLLSPAQRPVQVTNDLASFWSSTYFEVKKDLKGRYPKHYWPDDPLQAVATNRVRPREQQ